MRMFTAVLFLLAALGFVLAQSAGNQTVSSNSVAEPGTRFSGKVTDETGTAVPAVRIVATGNDGQTYQTASNSEGRFDLAVPVGNYRIEFSLYGFSELHLTNFSVPSTSREPITAVLQHDPNIVIHDTLSCFAQVDPIPVEELSVSSEIYTELPRRKTPLQARLSGTVYDANGAVIPGATVTAVDSENRVLKSKTNEMGVFVLDLPFNQYDPSLKEFNAFKFKIAKYDISAEAPNFIKSVVKDFRIVPIFRQQMQLDFALDIIGPDPCHDPTACIQAVPVQNRTSVPSSEVIPQKASSPKRPQ